MQVIELSQTGQALVALAVVLAMFVMFVKEWYPTEVVAIGGAGVMLVLGQIGRAHV